MSVGQKAYLTCTPDYAYGSDDVGGGLIPANSTLVFEVELLSIGN
jgi:FK506-binding protein 1